MSDLPPTLILQPRQSRYINAAEGFRLEVASGCLWLTRPNDPADHFLAAGAAIELHENHVLIESDRHPATSSLAPARYMLVPLPAPGSVRHGPSTAFWKLLLQRLGGNRLQQA